MNKALSQLFAGIILMLAQVCLAGSTADSQQQKVKTMQQSMREDLSAGRIEEARSTLEQAAANFHSVEIELGLIQTLMQSGEYRHALSAAAHTQAEHPDLSETSLFYAWLLAIGGQAAPAMQLLQAAIDRHPDNSVLRTALLQMQTQHLDPSSIITSGNIQLSPFIPAASLSPTFRHIASGVVISEHAQVMVPFSAVENVKRIRVRNGLGAMAGAHIERSLPGQGLAILALEGASIRAQSPAVAASMPFPGSLVYIIGYAQGHPGLSGWPQLKVDVLGTPAGAVLHYPLHVQSIAAGSGVYDRSGQLLGVVTTEPAGGYSMTPITAAQAGGQATARAVDGGREPMDEIFESSLNNVVQVLVEE